jgi:hypothetical protein
LVANFNRFAGRSTADVPSEIGWVSLPRRPIIAAIAANEGISEMAKAYYSTVFEQPAPEVWKIVRDFNNYPVWVGGAGESEIEDGKSGDTVGAVRNVLYQERQIRQRLLAQSDVERSQTYEFAGAPTLPVTGYQATLRITPIVDGDRTFVEWWATFDCDAGQRDQLTGTLAGSFEKWLESLRDTLAD